MGSFEEFEQNLRDALANLYNPLYEPAALIIETMGAPWAQGGTHASASVQSLLAKAIDELRPSEGAPASAPIRKLYEILQHRYIERLTQESTAELLGITPRYVRDLQVDAIRVLAKRFWDQYQSRLASAERGSGSTGVDRESTGRELGLNEWSAQMRDELSSLSKLAPDMGAPVGAILHAATRSAQAFIDGHNLRVTCDQVDLALRARIHPAAFRQLVLSTIVELARGMFSGQIAIRCEHQANHIRVLFEAAPVTSSDRVNLAQVAEILAVHQGSMQIIAGACTLDVEMLLPAMPPADLLPVLVVDDNEDLVSFYRSYVSGTAYEIRHVSHASQVFHAIDESKPHIIVLDIMLPDPEIDGWELLVHLHNHPSTRSIPVIVCSVVGQAELALALGASLYLPKPVRRRQFVEALNQVRDLAA